MDFKYKAKGSDGKIVEGVISGDTQDAAVALMRQRGLFPITMEARGKSSSEGSFLQDLKKMGTVSLRDKVVFFRQLATMIQAGVTLGNALSILSEQTKNHRLADAIRKIKNSVDGGFSLSGAMKSRSEFSTLMVSIIQAGEEGGKLEESIDRLATFLERQDELRRKIISSVTYPAVVVLFAFFILYLLVTVVMPKFSQVFKGLNVPLPKITLFMFDFSNWVAEFWYIPLLFLVTLAVAVVMLNRNQTTKPGLDMVKLRLPVLGDIFFKCTMARSNRTLASLVDAGVPILRSLEMTAEVTNNAEDSQANL